MSTNPGSAPSVSTQGASFVATSVNHPRFIRTDTESIRVFLRLYDQYTNDVTARAQQLTATGSTSTEPIRPVNLKFCVDPEYLESAIALGFIGDVSTYSGLTDSVLRSFLEEKAAESPEAVTLEALDATIQRELRMNMSHKHSRSRMEALFVSYHSLLRRNGITWLLEKNQKVAVAHILSTIHPATLRSRLQSDLDFAYHELKKDFKGFMKHAIKVSEAFQITDPGPKQGKAKESKSGNRSGGTSTGNQQTDTVSKKSSKGIKAKRPTPDCPFSVCKAIGLKQYIKNCPSSTQEEKTKMFEDLKATKARDGPSRSTRRQTGTGTSLQPPSTDSSTSGSKGPSAGRLNKKQSTDTVKSPTGNPSGPVTGSDGRTKVKATGRCDDGSDDSLVSRSLAERAVLKGIGRMTAISPVRLSVALKTGEEAAQFTFSRSWTPRTVLHLSSGQLALVNVTFLVADDELTNEDLLIGLPVLQHLQVDTRTLLGNHLSELDGTDCSAIGNPAALARGGAVSRMMVSRLNRIQEPDAATDNGDALRPSRPRVNYYTARSEEDPFPDPSLLDPLDAEQHSDIRTAIQKMTAIASEAGLPDDSREKLHTIVENHIDIFRTGFSAGPPAKLPPLRVELTRDARPVKVRLRNYSQEQRNFLSEFVDQLHRNGMVYSNPTSPWACAPLLVPKPGLARFRFTIDLRPVNKYTVRHQYPMPNLEHELTKLSESLYYATFDFSHGYWQLQLDKASQPLQWFITPDGIFTPTRVLHGTTNAVTHLQSSLMAILPPGLRKHTLLWLGDCLLHHSTVNGLLEAIQEFFTLCASYNLKLHPAKCVLFAKQIRWCGRLISPLGVRFDPRQMEGLLNMALPTTGGHLQQFLCALQWVHSGIPSFSTLIKPLHGLMERVYHRAGKRTKRSVNRVQLSAIGWDDSLADSFNACKNSLSKQVTLSHRDESKRLCVYTDASDTIWSGILTQVPFSDLPLHPSE